MMNFTISNSVVAGESAGNGFVITSTVDPDARTCDTTGSRLHAASHR